MHCSKLHAGIISSVFSSLYFWSICSFYSEKVEEIKWTVDGFILWEHLISCSRRNIIQLARLRRHYLTQSLQAYSFEISFNQVYWKLPPVIHMSKEDVSADVFKFKLKPNTTSKLPEVYRTLVRVESVELHAELRSLSIPLPSRKHRQWPVCSLLYIGNMSPYQHMNTTDRNTSMHTRSF